MNKKTLTIIIGAALLALLIGASALYSSLSKEDPPTLSGEAPAVAETAAPTPNTVPAPDFSMADADGNTAKLSDFAGTPVVLNFWASWCGPCKNEMPHFDALAAEYEGKVQFLMVNLTDGGRETVDSASKFVSGQGYTFPVFYDTGYEGASAYGVRSIPVTYFINADGNIVTYYAGSMSESTLREGVGLIYSA